MADDLKVDREVEQLSEALNSLLLMSILLVVLIILIVGVECFDLIGWIIKFCGKSASDDEKHEMAVSKKHSSKKNSSSKCNKKHSSKKNSSSKASKKNKALSKSSKNEPSNQSIGRSPCHERKSNQDQKPIACVISSHTKAVQPLAVMNPDKATSPCHPTTRAAESHDERSVKHSKDSTSGSGRPSKTAPVAEVAQLPHPPKKVLSKEEHRVQVRDMLRARKTFLGELPMPEAAESEEKLKPKIKTAVVIEMPPLDKKLPEEKILAAPVILTDASSKKASEADITKADVNSNKLVAVKEQMSHKPPDENKSKKEEPAKEPPKKEAPGSNFPYGSPV